MPAQIDAREEAPRRATDDARMVLAKHPCVTLGGVGCAGDSVVSEDLLTEGDRRSVSREGEDAGGGQHAAGASGAE